MYRLYVSGKCIASFSYKRDADAYALHFREVDESEGKKRRAYTVRLIKDKKK